MPISSVVNFKRMDQDGFHSLDKQLMRQAFDIYNEMGKFCDEPVYQEELAGRCRKIGFGAEREVLVPVKYQDFTKPYYLDLLVESAVIYEIKAVDQLSTVHEQQLINYLLLTGMSHGKLINFASNSVEYRFVSTRLTPKKRHDFILKDQDLCSSNGGAEIKSIFLDIVKDLGAFFDVGLYEGAMIHCLHGPAYDRKLVEIYNGGRVVGRQKFCLLEPDSAWHISGAKNQPENYSRHLQKLLNHRNLSC